MRRIHPLWRLAYGAAAPTFIILPVLLLTVFVIGASAGCVFLWLSAHRALAVLCVISGLLIGVGFMRGCSALARDFNCHVILLQAKHLGEKLTRGEVERLADTASVMGGWWLANRHAWEAAKRDDEVVEGRWLR